MQEIQAFERALQYSVVSSQFHCRTPKFRLEVVDQNQSCGVLVLAFLKKEMVYTLHYAQYEYTIARDSITSMVRFAVQQMAKFWT